MSDSEQSYIDKINQLTSQPSTPSPPAKGLTDGGAAMANGSQAMLAQAQSGALVFDPQTGQSLINTLTQHIKDLNLLEPHIKQINRETKLGSTAGGQAMTKFNQEVASSGTKAFEPAHRQFVATLQTMVKAIQVAMDNYTNTDADNAQTLKAKD